MKLKQSLRQSHVYSDNSPQSESVPYNGNQFSEDKKNRTQQDIFKVPYGLNNRGFSQLDKPIRSEMQASRTKQMAQNGIDRRENWLQSV